MGARKDIESIEQFFSNADCGSFEGRAIAAFAHPDDASIAFGAQLGRFLDLDLIVVTDGAPTHLNYAANKGFGSTDAYAQVRWDEMEAALNLMGIPNDRARTYGFDDGSVCRRLVTLIERLHEDLAGAEIVLTHCFEGGHTDHDAVAMAVHLACATIDEERRPVIVEAPLYSLQAGLFTTQTVPAGGSGSVISVALTAEQQLLKRQIKICYRSQRYSLAQFKDDLEPYRIAPLYDFDQLANNGALLYEVNGFLSGPQWLSIVRTCKAYIERPRESAPAVTIDQSVEILKRLIEAAPPPAAALPVPASAPDDEPGVYTRHAHKTYSGFAGLFR